MLKIVVPIKQVPEVSEVRMNEETGTLIRDGVPSIINPFDEFAIEAAIQLKEAHGGKHYKLGLKINERNRNRFYKLLKKIRG